ncbi:beta-N-acetylhexosaminidase [Tamlana sedimentorum]|uniref:beta-N-acetylhexosaminidase n=1 Tax=Neotamlana sedimentorum TaxID=1435349 RepID=A0A0D7W7H4_9FLAO|nr:family 20 glycosylhydrolase [Tamlana sedimentorum]KJD35095.1 beta-N-acetylhexosaminidase [Tamlana sedimentorum]
MKKASHISFFVLFTVGILLNSCQEKSAKVYTEADVNIIPKVAHLNITEGVFQFNENTVFVVSNEEQKQAVKLLIDKFNNAANWNLKITAKTPTSNYISLALDNSLEQEAYTINASTSHVVLKASSASGFLYAIQSLRQLLPVEIESDTLIKNIDWEIPNVQITDSPRFKWRGLMLDVSRHFFGKDYIKETIDMLALHKMNILHLHLVDDQGWRIEIKKYPKLTEIGAWRVDQEHLLWNAREDNNPDDKGTYGGFLTQEDLKEIVAYAATKGVEVVPEIEMPAHVSSAIAAYPELSCHGEQIAVPSGALWPITDIYCAGKESTFEFLENVLLEVMDIFPSKYIHIGGDEATKTNWEVCPHCKKRIKAEKLENVEELQSYFIKRIEKFINSKGKKLIGWDEILEGGLAPEATVMSWRGVKGGIEAAKHGNDAIMSPVGYCYFDYYQGTPDLEPKAAGPVTTVSKVYQFEPIVGELFQEEEKHILGGQANVWAEHIPTEEHSQYMIFPRLTALSETLWSPKESRNWNDFSVRLKSIMNRFEYLDVNYAKSAYIINSKVKTDIQSKSVAITLQNEFPDSDIRYVLNDADLNSEAIPFTKPIVVNRTTAIKASLFEADKPINHVFKETITFHEGVASKVDYLTNYHERYQGSHAFNLVNTLRGSKDFRDGRWQAWLNKDAKVVVDLGEEKNISKVIIGSMVNQKNSVYYPTEIKVLLSHDNENFTEVGKIKKPFKVDDEPELKDFSIDFKAQKARYIKVEAKIDKSDIEVKEAWIFMDEILID